MKKILFYLTLLPICALQAQNDMNTATGSGVWDVCPTWGNPIAIYNSTAQPKTINNGVTVTLNKTEVYAKKITLEGNGKIDFSAANKITFSPYAGAPVISGSALPTCTATGIGGAKIIDNVTVDFAQSVTAKSMSGFTHGLYKPFPTNSDVTPLQPKLFRMVYEDTNDYNRAYGLSGSGRIHYLASDGYTKFYSYLDTITGIPVENPGQVINNSVPYDAYLDNLFNWGNGKPGIVWECWNEPRNKEFWFRQENPNQLEFFKTYKQFYGKLRNKLGASALVAGPSISQFDAQYFHDFFDYCLDKNLEVNVVTWHELTDYQPISLIQDNVEYVRKNFMENPKYASLKIQSIEINEIVDCLNTYNPVAISAYLGNLEKAGVDYAAKSCWCEETLCNLVEGCVGGCYGASLNHLFDHTTHAKKAGYWAYKLYADGVPTRVKSVNEEGNSIVIANGNNMLSPHAKVLFGYTDTDYSSGLYKIKLLNLSYLAGEEKIIKLYKIPNPAMWNEPLADPVFVQQITTIHPSPYLTFTAQRNTLYLIEIVSSLE